MEHGFEKIELEKVRTDVRNIPFLCPFLEFLPNIESKFEIFNVMIFEEGKSY